MDKNSKNTETTFVRKSDFPDVNKPPPEVIPTFIISVRITFSWDNFVLNLKNQIFNTEIEPEIFEMHQI
jgi:hypothetical protein